MTMDYVKYYGNLILKLISILSKPINFGNYNVSIFDIMIGLIVISIFVWFVRRLLG